MFCSKVAFVLPIALLVATGFGLSFFDVSSATEPVGKVSEGGVCYTLYEDGGECTATAGYDSEEGASDITIKATVQHNGKTYSITAIDIGDHEFSYSPIEKLTIKDNAKLKSLPEYCLLSCDRLTEVTLGEGLEGLGEGTFFGCTSLNIVNLPSTLSTIGDSTFMDCSSLTEIRLPPGLFDIGLSVFSGCTSLSSITVDESNGHYSSDADGVLFNKDKTVLIRYPLARTGASYVVPDSVGEIGDDAFNCSLHLTTVTFPDGLTSIGDSAFSFAGLASAVLPSGLTSIGEGAFFKAKLTELTIPGGVTSIGNGILSGCPLESITVEGGTVPDRFCENVGTLMTANIGATMIGSSAFKGCKNLSTLSLSDGLVGIGGSAFEGCVSLSSVILPDGLENLSADAFKNCSLTEVALPSSIEVCGTGVFDGCSSLRSVTLPDDIPWIKERMFRGCESLQTIDLKGATSIGASAFFKCSSLRSVSSISNVENIGTWAFAYCESLAEITLGEKLTSIGSGAFSGTALESISIPAKVRSMDFSTSSSIFVFPKSLKSITVDESNADFSSRGGILYSKDMKTVLACPASITGELVVDADVGMNAFRESGLSKITFTSDVSKIDAFALYKSAVKTVVLPDSIKEIGGGAFASSNIQSLVLPEGVSLGLSSLPSGMKYVSFPQSLSGGAFSGPQSLWGNAVAMYDSDGTTQIRDNELDKIKGQRFVWDGSNAGKLFLISESQVLLTTNVGDEISYKVVSKGSVYAPEPPAVPEHSTFGGWFTDPGFSEKYDAAVPLDADTAVYALFSPETHTVTYRVDGEVVGDVETYEYGKEVSVRAAYIKTGYTVGAWASESVVPVEGRFTIGEADVVFTATSVVNQYTITFDTVGGSGIAPARYDYGTAVNVPGAPAKGGFVFIRWDPAVPATMPANDVAVRAVWMVAAIADEDGAAEVEPNPDTHSFIPSAGTKRVTVRIGGNTAVRMDDAAGLPGKVVVSRVEPVPNGTGIAGNAYDLTLTVDGTPYSGKVLVTLPYAKEDGKGPAVYFWNGSESVKMNVVSSTEASVTFETDHNSVYVVASEAPPKDDDSDTLLFGLAVAGAVVAMLVGLYLGRRRLKQ